MGYEAAFIQQKPDTIVERKIINADIYLTPSCDEKYSDQKESLLVKQLKKLFRRDKGAESES